jgi:hypothetical protein
MPFFIFSIKTSNYFYILNLIIYLNITMKTIYKRYSPKVLVFLKEVKLIILLNKAILPLL